MNLSRKDLYTIAGLGLIVGSLFAGAKALGGFVALIYIVASTNYTEPNPSLHETLATSWKTSHASGMVHGVGSFLILFFGGRWMLRGPKLLDCWIDGDGRTQTEGFVPSESSGAKDRSDQAEDTTPDHVSS